MYIDLSSAPTELRGMEQAGKSVVVIDVLRACTTMVYAFSNGCEAIYTCATVNAARNRFKQIPSGRALLGGERNGTRVRGFHLGNSPGEYSSDVVRGKTVVFTTTNCTKTLAALKRPKEALICSFINLPAVAEYLSKGDADVLLALCGTDGQMSLEDAVCGGMLIYELLKKRDIAISDPARITYGLYRHYGRSVRQALLDSNHGKRLLGLGFKDDIRLCAAVGKYNIIPRYVRGRVTLPRS